MNISTTTVHIDDLGDVTVMLLTSLDAPCPNCGTPGDTPGWRLLTVRPFDVFRCPECRTPCAISDPLTGGEG